MKIIHIVIGNSYTDGWAYQENLLPEAHKRLGHEVSVIASTENAIIETEYSKIPNVEYSINGVKIIRLKPNKVLLNSRFSIHSNLLDVISTKKPDLIFIHGLSFLSLSVVKEYKLLNPNVVIFADTHADQFNSVLRYKIINKNLIHKGIWKHIIKKNLPFIDRIYHTTSATKAFAEKMYEIPNSKLYYLPMGGEAIVYDKNEKEAIVKKVRNKYDITENNLLLVSGGRFDRRKNIDKVIKALSKINNCNIKLLIFGKFEEDSFQKEVQNLIKIDERIRFIGWINPTETRDLFISADLGIFPGTQSIMWRNAVTCGLPLICRYTHGAEEIDVNGNAIHMFTDEPWAWKQMIENIIEVPELLTKLKQRTIKYGVPFFDNDLIGQKVIDDYYITRNKRTYQ